MRKKSQVSQTEREKKVEKYTRERGSQRKKKSSQRKHEAHICSYIDYFYKNDIMKKFNAISPLYLFGTTLLFFFASNHQSAMAEYECPTFGNVFFFSFSPRLMCIFLLLLLSLSLSVY